MLSDANEYRQASGTANPTSAQSGLRQGAKEGLYLRGTPQEVNSLSSRTGLRVVAPQKPFNKEMHFG